MSREILHDLRYALRILRRSPGFTAVALLTMALGIGANTAMFSLVNGILLKPLPYPKPDRIVLLRETNLSRGWTSFTVAPLNLWDWEEQNRSLEMLAAYYRNSVNYSGGDRPESVSACRVTEDFLEILGGQPVMGRGITVEDLDPDAEAVVLLTHGFWQRAFGGDPDVLGRTMLLDDVAHTIVGVLPEDWRPFFTGSTDVILPLVPEPNWYTNRGSHFLVGLGRLRDGVTLDQAQADLASIAAGLEAQYPDTNDGWGASVRPLKEVLLGSTRPTLWIFMASVGLVLLIACANLANMTLARATVRTRELAIRTAVGAGRARVVRQLLVESLLLAAAGGALGVTVAHSALRGFVTGWPILLPRMHEVGMDGTVLVFALGLVVASGVLFGLAPALSVVGSNLSEFLRQGGRSIAGDRSRRWMRAGLVVAEIALAVVLLVGTALLVRSLSALQAEDPGFRTEDRLVFTTGLPEAKYTTPEEILAFGSAAQARLEALPGVEEVAITSLIPLEGSDQIWGFWREEHATPGSQEDGSALFYRVSPGYHEAMGIPILAGRSITPEDRPDSRLVVVISESLAEQHFPGESPLGKRIRFGRGDDDPPVEIVGVAGNVQHYVLGRTSIPQLYVPFTQRTTGFVNWVIRAGVPPLSLVGGVREAIRAVDPDQPVVGIQEADALIADAVSVPRFRTLLMTGFGLTGLLLAVVGLYGVLAYSVSQRSREIGVRVALGASRGAVLGLILREGVPLLAMGLAVGVAGALALSQVLAAMLFGVGSRDPAVFAFVPTVLAAVATVAMLIPARRAAGLDPVRTLGDE